MQHGQSKKGVWIYINHIFGLEIIDVILKFHFYDIIMAQHEKISYFAEMIYTNKGIIPLHISPQECKHEQ